MEWENNSNQPQSIPQQPIPSEPALVAAAPIQGELVCKLIGFGYFFKKTFSIYKNNFWTFLFLVLVPFVIPFLSSLLFSLLPSFSKSLILLVLIYLVRIIISIWFGVSLLYAIKERENKMGIGKSLEWGLSNFRSYVWVSFLVLIITIGGFILFIVPGIIFTVWYSLSVYVFVYENKKGMDALKRSKELISGYVTAF